MRKFPKANDDGSFAVRVCFANPPGASLADIRHWLAEWTSENSLWTLFNETYRFSDDFRRAPEPQFDEAGRLTFTLYGVNVERRFWRDWYVRLAGDLMKSFPEIGPVLNVRNADDAE
jgi:hypothetical protein